jgi:hypothetical protein
MAEGERQRLPVVIVSLFNRSESSVDELVEEAGRLVAVQVHYVKGLLLFFGRVFFFDEFACCAAVLIEAVQVVLSVRLTIYFFQMYLDVRRFTLR